MANVQLNIRFIESKRGWTFDFGAKCTVWKLEKREIRYWNFDNRTCLAYTPINSSSEHMLSINSSRVKIDKTPWDSDIDILTCGKQTVENGKFNWHDFRKL